jgi:hypothetical protein
VGALCSMAEGALIVSRATQSCSASRHPRPIPEEMNNPVPCVAWSNRKSRDGDENHGPHGCAYCYAVSTSCAGFRSRRHRSEKSTSQTMSQRIAGAVKSWYAIERMEPTIRLELMTCRLRPSQQNPYISGGFPFRQCSVNVTFELSCYEGCYGVGRSGF